jgi:CheY-like chemotaxis protein
MEEVNLLYIDKSKTARNLLAKGLDAIANVTGVGSLAEAREAIAAGSFNFIILDYELPDGDGLTLAAELRANPAHTKTPIILYTASLNNELEYRAMRAGINEGLAKPINMFDMMQYVVSQIELPCVKHVRRQLLQLTCFSWKTDGKHFEYSPDLGLLLSGDDKQLLREQMHSALEEKIMAKDDPGQYPADIEVYKHILNLTPEADKAA